MGLDPRPSKTLKVSIAVGQLRAEIVSKTKDLMKMGEEKKS